MEMTRTIAVAQFKEKCLAILDQVDLGVIVITKHGRPVAKLIPFARTFGAPDRQSPGKDPRLRQHHEHRREVEL